MIREIAKKRSYVFELDLLRTLTVLSVIGVHVLSFSGYRGITPIGIQLQDALVVALHFTREVFMFVTAFALVYVYERKSISLKQFWSKRGFGVIFPYCFWSCAYILVALLTSGQTISWQQLSQLTFYDIISGNASYQLYYILLTIQFYLIFPLFLFLLKRVARHPWIVLVISFVLQVVLFYLDYHHVQQNNPGGFWLFVNNYQDRFVLTYQFYFVLGGIAALYLTQIRAFLLRRLWFVIGVMLFALAGLWLHFLLQIRIEQQSLATATSVLQPVMIFYSLAVILFMFGIACFWARKASSEQPPRGYNLIHMLAEASFGVYLIHVFFLTFIQQHVLPHLPANWSPAMQSLFSWFVTAACAVTVTWLLLQIPVLSRLVGRPATRKPEKLVPQPEQEYARSVEQTGNIRITSPTTR